MNGTVKFWDAEKGWGFIKPDDGSQDLFVHRSGIVGSDQLEDRAKVSFDQTEGPKGPKAINVEPV
jgi:CspA family cold shock protein